jgi:hypothetical protein
MRTHIKVLAWLHILLGAMTLVGALILFLVFGGIATAAAATATYGSGVAALIAGSIGAVMFICVGVFAIPQLLLGWGLLNGAPWARVLGIVISILSLVHPVVGLGTLLGIYGLVVLFNPETVQILDGPRAGSY